MSEYSHLLEVPVAVSMIDIIVVCLNAVYKIDILLLQDGHKEIVVVTTHKYQFRSFPVTVHEVDNVVPFLRQIPGKFLLKIPVYY